jgi:HPt (histidine-containing phosphotransfer) domain-containing protein
MVEVGSVDESRRIRVVVDEDIADLIPEYLERRYADVGAIRSAIEDGDFETVRILGHGMKGSGGGYGFDAITLIGAALEQAGIHADAVGAEASIDELADYLTRLEVSYE